MLLVNTTKLSNALVRSDTSFTSNLGLLAAKAGGYVKGLNSSLDNVHQDLVSIRDPLLHSLGNAIRNLSIVQKEVNDIFVYLHDLASNPLCQNCEGLRAKSKKAQVELNQSVSGTSLISRLPRFDSERLLR